MLFSVIVPTCNRNDLLSKCLDRLSYSFQTIHDFEYEVIVTDDSQDCRAKDLLTRDYTWAKWIPGPQKGPAANRNNGAKHANGEWLVFIDDDCLPENKLLHEYKEAINKYPQSLAFEGAILPDDWELLKKDMSECPVNTEGGCFWSANISINKLLFEKINGFDEGYLIAAQEDQDIFERLKVVTSVIFLEKCILIHPVRFITLQRKLSLVNISIKNWYLFVKKKKNFSLCLTEGIKSQLKALINNVKARKIRSVLYHIYVILVFFPLMISFKNIKNE